MINLSLKDKKILSVIEVDGHLAYSEIAKKIGLSKQIVKYRMDLLEKENIIQEYYAVVNDSRLGREVYFVYIQLNSLTNEDEKSLIHSLKKNPNILSYFSSMGNWDFVLALHAKNHNELNKNLKSCLGPINNKIRNRVISSIEGGEYLSSKIFSSMGRKNISAVSGSQEKIDKLDLDLINELMGNGRATLVELATKFHMSANGIRERVKSLEKKEVIYGYKTKINYEKLGFLHVHFFVWAKSFDSEFYKKLKSFLIQDGKTEFIAKSFGYADVEFRCNLESIGELYELKRKIKNHFKENINSIESLIVVRSGLSHLKK